MFPTFLSSTVHEGCYKEDLRHRAFAVPPGEYDTNTITPIICSQKCASFGLLYAALAQGIVCNMYMCCCSFKKYIIIAKIQNNGLNTYDNIAERVDTVIRIDNLSDQNSDNQLLVYLESMDIVISLNIIF